MEGEAVHRVFKLAELAETPAYIVHLSSRDALNAVREARDRGMPAFAETCTQYLYLAETTWRTGVRGREVRVLAAAATGRAPGGAVEGAPRRRPADGLDRSRAVQLRGQKDLGKDDFSKIPNGLPSVEDRFTLLYGGVEAATSG